MIKLLCTSLFSISIFFALAQQNIQLKKRSIALVYKVPDTLKPIQFYAEILIDSLSKNKPTIFASYFNNGYLGVEIDQQKNKYLVFNYGSKKDTNVQIITKGLQVNTTNNHSLKWAYSWQKNELYKCLLTIIADSATNTTYYTGYIFLPKENLWKLLGTFKVNQQFNYITNPSILLVANSSLNKKNIQKVTINTVWLQRANGNWKELDTALIVSNTKQLHALNNNAGKLVLAKIGLQENSIYKEQKNELLYAKLSNQRPMIDVTKHVDSANQLQLDIEEILNAVATGKIDTTASSNYVYYKILKQGSGPFVNINDTVTIYYKGSLLKDNSVFDETKDKPATFPLKRLIRGWQIGLVQCKVGGKIRLFIPSALAYSIRSRSKAIPPNSVLIFDIEVLSVK